MKQKKKKQQKTNKKNVGFEHPPPLKDMFIGGRTRYH